METQTIFDLRYNIAALYIAILRKDIFLPEQAFAYISDTKYRLTDDDTLDMIAMVDQGLYLEEIGEIYGICPSGVFRRIERYNRRREKEGANET